MSITGDPYSPYVVTDITDPGAIYQKTYNSTHFAKTRKDADKVARAWVRELRAMGFKRVESVRSTGRNEGMVTQAIMVRDDGWRYVEVYRRG